MGPFLFMFIVYGTIFLIIGIFFISFTINEQIRNIPIGANNLNQMLVVSIGKISLSNMKIIM